jgi:diaminohydroxyphosphoribosylaminopyrimidine deaminase/5-amino-6-(5-phosphoribosylamino)uracil reductase
MHRCIELAKLGAGNVAPNPMVGALLVYEDKIIGEGYHRQYGLAHAEVNCISNAEKRAVHFDSGDPAALLRKSRLYVSLEPCVHFGKTPPCADLIIKKGIPEVVVGCRDPFKQVDGRGIKKLEEGGVKVHTGILEEECKRLNKRFFTFHEQHRPYIILKWAQTADGKIAGPGGRRVFITNEITNREVHKWRSEEPAIMVGPTTALMDDPSLTTRLWSGNNPVRLVLDMNLRLPNSLRIFNSEGKTIIFNTLREGEKDGLTYHKLNGSGPVIAQLAGALYDLNIQSVLVEGGARLIQSFFEAHLWDEARIITNTELEIGDGVNAPILPQGVLVNRSSVGSDTIRIFQRLHSAS